MPLFDKILGKGLGDILDKGADIADRFILTKEDKLKYEELQAEREFREEQYETETIQRELDRHLEYYQTDQIDRADARSLNKSELEQDDKFIRRFRYYLALLIVVCCFGFFGVLMFSKNPRLNQDYIMYFAGSINGILTVVIAYFFGSSQGSFNKQGQIDNLMKDKKEGS